MKRKIFSILFALVLVLGFSLVPVAPTLVAASPYTAEYLASLGATPATMTVGLVAGSGYVPVAGYTSYTGVDLSVVGASEIYGVTPDGTVVQLTPDATDPDLHFNDAHPAGTYLLYVHQTSAGTPWVVVTINHPPTPVTYTITASAGEHGSIAPSGPVVVNEGEDQAFTITAAEGYSIADVLVDGVSVLEDLVDGTYTFVNVTADGTIAASFTSAYDTLQPLNVDWTLISTDKALATGELDRIWVGVTLALKYIPTTGFVSASLADLEPLTAIYVKTVDGGLVGFNYAEVEPGVYSKDLEAGWNLISTASTTGDAGDILSPLRYVTVGTQQVFGLSTLVSQGDYNRFGVSFYKATLTDADWDALNMHLSPFNGYWLYMNAAKSFEVIP